MTGIREHKMITRIIRIFSNYSYGWSNNTFGTKYNELFRKQCFRALKQKLTRK
jgi:hypothetical protein